jgi:predicted DNA-binding transcriptional regulator AlpA
MEAVSSHLSGEPSMRAATTSNPTNKLAFKQAEVARMLSMSTSTFNRMRRAGVAPRPDVSIGAIKLWSHGTIMQWIADQSKASAASNAI